MAVVLALTATVVSGATALAQASGGVSTTVISLPVLTQVAGVAVGAGAVWVANARAGTVSRIDPLTNQVVATIAVAEFERMARWGQGYVGGPLPAPAVARWFEQARGAWANAGRGGSPRLVAIAYFALSEADRARSNIWDFYSITRSLARRRIGLAGFPAAAEFADPVASAVLVSPAALKEAVKAFEDIGADELILNPALDDIQEVVRLAEAVL